MAKQKATAGDGCLCQNSKDIWIVKIKVPGRKNPKEISFGTRDEREARIKYEKWKHTTRYGSKVDYTKRPATLRDMLRMIEDDYSDNRYKSISKVRGLFKKHIFQYFGEHKRIDEIGKREIQAYKRWREMPVTITPTTRWGKFGKNVSYERIAHDESINTELAKLAKGFKLAVSEKAIRLDQVPEITKYPVARTRKTAVTDMEIPALHGQFNEYVAAAFRCIELTGWRSGTIEKMIWSEHVLWDQRCLYLPPGFTKSTKKKPSPAWTFPLDTIYPNGELAQLMDEQSARRDRLQKRLGRIIPWVFFDEEGKPFKRTLWGFFNRACRKAKIAGKKPHDFRSTAARRLTAFGLRPKEVMALVGWTDIASYLRYCFVDADDVQKIRVARDRAIVPYVTTEKVLSVVGGQK